MGLRFGGRPVNRLWRGKQNFGRDHWTLRFNERLESCQIFFAYFVCLKKNISGEEDTLIWRAFLSPRFQDASTNSFDQLVILPENWPVLHLKLSKSLSRFDSISPSRQRWRDQAPWPAGRAISKRPAAPQILGSHKIGRRS